MVGWNKSGEQHKQFITMAEGEAQLKKGNMN